MTYDTKTNLNLLVKLRFPLIQKEKVRFENGEKFPSSMREVESVNDTDRNCDCEGLDFLNFIRKILSKYLVDFLMVLSRLQGRTDRK